MLEFGFFTTLLFAGAAITRTATFSFYFAKGLLVCNNPSCQGGHYNWKVSGSTDCRVCVVGERRHIGYQCITVFWKPLCRRKKWVTVNYKMKTFVLTFLCL